MNANHKKLIDDHRRLIDYEVHNHAKFVPKAVVLSEAHELAHEAAKSFDPKAGVKFSTHLTNQLKKLSRLSTQYGAVVRIPENRQFRGHRVVQIQQSLKAELNRDPSLEEIAEASGLPIQQISALLNQKKKEVNLNNLSHQPVFIDDSNDDWVHLVYHDLSYIDKLIFEHKTGFGGKEVLNNEEIAKLVKLSPATVANRVKIITERIQEGWN